jgi:ATP-dependent Clp protease ATP-binding subunit ClpB
MRTISLRSAQGNVVNFRNTVIIFTSNVGSEDILDLSKASDVDNSIEIRRRVTNAMKSKFKPEFLNRIDETVIFNSLGKEQLIGIVRLEVSKLRGRLHEKPLQFVANVGLGDAEMGARPLKRIIQRELEKSIAKLILTGDACEGTVITCEVDEITDRLKMTCSTERQ